MLKLIAYIGCILFLSSNLYSQHIPSDLYALHQEYGLSIGYAHSSHDNSRKNYHLLEFEFLNTKYFKRHYAAMCKYVGIEVAMNTRSIIYGPKAGISLNYGPFLLGGEVIVYTDFDKSTFRAMPYFGLGTHLLKITVGYQINVVNRRFTPLNQGQINIAYQFIKLKETVLSKNVH
ncbi:MAG: hypothetical protein P1U56_08965 [Saprospiraceae bacterium]|nr:hypothetical protein [Saprospiraceae bacterium]